MNWHKVSHTVWQRGWKNQIVASYMIAEVDESTILLVFAHYGKQGAVKKYSAWLQNRNMLHGGDNFALKIRDCSSFEEGMRIAEKFNADFAEGNKPKAMGTQYITDTTFEGPFFDT